MISGFISFGAISVAIYPKKRKFCPKSELVWEKRKLSTQIHKKETTQIVQNVVVFAKSTYIRFLALSTYLSDLVDSISAVTKLYVPT